MKELLARLQASFTTLSQRERRLVMGAGGGFLLFAVFMGWIMDVPNRRD